MDDMIAKYICGCAIRSSTDIRHVLDVAKPFCTDEEYKALLKGVATAVEGVLENVMEPILSKFPHLREQMEDSIQRYSVLIW